jgi:hypothetical protein
MPLKKLLAKATVDRISTREAKHDDRVFHDVHAEVAVLGGSIGKLPPGVVRSDASV